MHISVLAGEVVELLAIKPWGVYWDVTGGAGGHARLILEKLNENGRLIISDCDMKAVGLLQKRFGHDGRCRIFHARFSEVLKIFKSENVPPLLGLVADLGFSGLQLDDESRGFSFQKKGPLDMRFDPRLEETAADLVANLSEKDLADLIFNLGGERHSRRLARALVCERQKEALDEAARLSDLAVRVLGPFYRRQKIHPATRLFQALRIAVNHELEELQDLLDALPKIIALKGRVAIITFHSLEDRLVKQAFRQLKVGGWQWAYKKPLVPSEGEMKQNPRSRSAKLRVIERR